MQFGPGLITVYRFIAEDGSERIDQIVGFLYFGIEFKQQFRPRFLGRRPLVAAFGQQSTGQ